MNISINQVLTIIAIAMVLLLTLISLINFEVFMEWAVKAIVAALVIGIFVKVAKRKW